MYKDKMEGYKVTKDGKVISYKQDKKGRILIGRLGRNGYLHVSPNGHTITIHRLVAWKYVAGYKKGLTVNHINGVKTDNRAENLEWISSKENSIHAMKYIESKNRLYTNDDIREIRRLYAISKQNKDKRYNMPSLAKKYGVSKVTISNIINRKRYEYIE